jgi:quercetin dioxygenase-like cupin family protein
MLKYGNLKIRLLTAGLMVSLATLTFAVNSQTSIINKNKDGLQWSNSKDLPGAKVAVLAGSPDKHEPFVARVKFPANFQIPAHSHPMTEYDTVISGAVYLKVDNKKNQSQEIVLNEGDFALLPAKVVHSGYTKDETIVQVSGIGPWGMVYIK